MGYSEAYCHLCGVSFNIGRHRAVGEPLVATFGGEDGLGTDPADLDLAACAEKGCVFALRPPDDPDDDQQAEEPYESDSDYDSSDAMSLPDDNNSNHLQTPSTDEALYHTFLSNTLRTANPRDYAGEPVALFAAATTKQTDTLIPIPIPSAPESPPDDLEHIPAPTCGSDPTAYPGSAISLAEMRGCRTAQFLIHKSQAAEPWRPDGLHEDWEVTGDWFLSGLCDGMRSRDCGFPDVWPARGGVRTVRADNVTFQPVDPHEIAMPIHPWCLDIFIRQSKQHFQKVDLDKLFNWRNSEFSYEEFHAFPRAADVFEARERWWNHVPGKEYLAANPLYVPGLPGLLAEATQQKSGSRGLDDGQQKTAVSCDPLGSLPLDLRLHLVGFLGAEDLAALRAASRAFTDLPNSVWYRLVREEMPWLWEAWGAVGMEEHTPSWWTTVTVREARFMYEARKHYAEVLRDESPDDQGLVDYLAPRPVGVPELVKLEKATTDWHYVYTQIKSRWGRLKGLRNRQRIWLDVEEIIRRMQVAEG
ncbi:uncharacterized protein BP01DRAFT_422949 [Aspergillus saccharolyticus JOP 1030-1]|uniref:F-box domain-containing protein n=1 Tax=Aspergillus saccharolyticus JOP 1030-1 TaxID=1450539 RepID=A0A318ZPQ1_9EURO|nr:hypothetical protein BP01DRAFT_422949 [Aspergillus saccharolyticus JOP 1030-1]PYH45900.1 hypothetical protein BP01DRAFT_422949 [Aspergillus saccharolyticus JOP 1030-1]